MQQGQEALAQLVEFALARLVGFHRDEGVVPTFSPYRHAELAQRAGEGAPPLRLRGGFEAGSEEAGRLGHYMIRRQLRAVKVLHSSS